MLLFYSTELVSLDVHWILDLNKYYYLVETFATILFNLCNAVTVVLCFVSVLCGCVCCYVRKKALLQCLQLR